MKYIYNTNIKSLSSDGVSRIWGIRPNPSIFWEGEDFPAQQSSKVSSRAPTAPVKIIQHNSPADIPAGDPTTPAKNL